MPPEQYTWLKDLHGKGKLLRPDQPARTFVHLVCHGIPQHVNGKVVEWDDRSMIVHSSTSGI